MTRLSRLRGRTQRARTLRSESGAAAVEAVLVTPLFLLLIFGIIELGPFFLNWNGVHSAAREGARVASVDGAAPETDFAVLADVKERIRGSIGGINYVIVFKATTSTDDPPALCVANARGGGSGVDDLCNVYYTADFSRPVTEFGNGTGSAADFHWPAPERIDWSSGPVDLVGVHVNSEHKTLTGALPSATLQYTTVFAIEATTGEGE